MAGVRVKVDGREVSLSNLDKVLYPARGTTKAEIIDYYARIAPLLLPHLADRAVSLVRYPHGVDGGSFVEKRCPPSSPAWVRTGGELGSCVVDGVATLVWLANLAALELHTHQHTVTAPDRPTAVVFDLDPGPPATVLDCARVALDLQRLLERLGLHAVVKTSGSKGLHVAVPLNTGLVGDEAAKAFALALGRVLADAAPERVTVSMAKAQRAGRVFVDWSQNDAHKTTVAAYSLRGLALPTVSTPVGWNEVSDALDGADPDALVFELDRVLLRVDERGDEYGANLSDRQELPVLG